MLSRISINSFNLIKRKNTQYFISLLLMLAFTTCTKVDLDQVRNLNNGKVEVIGHGGSGFQSLINPFPTNSFVSIKNAVDGLNADAIEIDLEVSKDSILILYHDITLEKFTNCNGCVNTRNSEEIVKCKYRNDYGSRAFKDQEIITFRTLIEYFKDRTRKPHIYVNTKIHPRCFDDQEAYYNKFAKLVASIIKKYNAYSWISVYDGDESFLLKIREIDPLIDLNYNAQGFDDALKIAENNNFNTIIIGNDKITKEQVDLAHSKEIKIVLWKIIRRKDVITAVEKSPDGLMTDNIPIVQEVLQQ